MAYGITALSAGEIAAEEAGRPLFIAKNALDYPRANTRYVWSTSSIGALTDVTDPNFPSWLAHDGQPHKATRPTDESALTYYFTAYLNEAETIDCIAIQMEDNGATAVDITVRIADSFSGNTNLLIVKSWSAVDMADGRLLEVNLNAHARYTNVPEIQIQFSNSSGTQVPRLAQFFTGKRRQLTRAFMTGFDPEALEAYADNFSTGLTTQRRIRHTNGLRNLDGSYMANVGAAHSMFSLDDAATIRGIYDDCLQGNRMLVYVENPALFDGNGFPHYFEWGYVNTNARLDLTDFVIRDWPFVFTEVPPAIAPLQSLPEAEAPYVNLASVYGTVGNLGISPGDPIEFDGATNMTIAFWFKSDMTAGTWTSSSYQPASKITGSGQCQFRIQAGAGRRLSVILPETLSDVANTCFGNTQFAMTDTIGGALTYFVVLTYDGTVVSNAWEDRAKWYVNGVDVGWFDAQGTDNPPAALPSGATSTLKFAAGLRGWQDHTAIWVGMTADKTLTPTQVAELYNAGAGLEYTGSSAGQPEFYLKFDNDYVDDGSVGGTWVASPGGGTYVFDDPLF